MENSRALALQLLARIEAEHAYTGLLLDAALRQSALEARDKALVTELVYGVTRWQKTLDWYANQVCKKPMAQTNPWLRRILRLGSYQLLFLDKIPPSAAINEAVKLAGKYHQAAGLPAQTAKGFVNAALRALDRQRGNLQPPATIADPIARCAAMYSYPEWLVQRWVARLGEERAAEACRVNNQPAPLMIRINPLKTSVAECQRLLASAVKTVTPLPDGLPGLILSGHPPIADLPGYREGYFTVQNAASMLIALLLEPQPGEYVLDACAGSGTKTTHLAELMHNCGEIRAVDLHTGKLRKLQENCQRLGVTIARPQQADVTTLARRAGQEPRQCDRLLLDAPCSGLGVLRRHPEAKWTRQPAQIREFQQLQLRLLRATAPLLRPGGICVYSVCTTEPEENEAVITEFLRTAHDFRLESVVPYLPGAASQSATAEGFLRIDPPQPCFDGFFAARLARQS